ncbi:agmatine/peptidylarginine deiminase [Terriglobus sp. TAA 43]|uniref:agmatine deiminase family protein n=1 Tax=Terriglobus sp. TAA 43 TaxID=278961 RepID=UPI00064780C0|nr:agmatine deiminase family protein [Terriglobus sp. TAA 43]
MTDNTGYRMPAEWDAHTSTWIAWPHNAEDWPGKFQPIPWVYSEIVKNLSQVEDVNILVNDERAQKVATRILTRAGANLARIHFHLWKTDRIWLRDSGPIFVKKANEVAITNWKFNAWAKYPNWHNDDLIPSHVAKHYNMRAFEPMIGDHRVVLEGGSIDVNGAGALLTTEECLLSEVQQRNPGISKQQLETCFHDYLGIDQVLWLNRGCAGDDTHGHVDDIARFTAVDTIVAATEHNTADENHLPLAENLDRLRSFRQPNGKPYNVIELPMPAPVIFDGERLPASYANFYIANDLVLVPTFNDANDRIALNILADQFPTRKIVGIHCGDFIWGLGALHCMTQQEPA